MIFIRNSNILTPKGDSFFTHTNQLSGRFKLDIYKVDSNGKRIEKSKKTVAEFDNLILNQGLDRLGSTGGGVAESFMNACQVGTGNSAPAVTDTGLQTRVAGTTNVLNTISTMQPTSPYYGSASKVYEFGVGAAAGNLSEVGVGWDVVGATLFSRALIVDGSNNPITITVLSDEILQVTYTIRLYPVEADTPAVVSISGTNYTFTRRPSNITTSSSWGITDTAGGNRGTSGFAMGNGVNAVQCYSGTLGAITTTPSGTSVSATARTYGSYTNGTYLTDNTATWGINVANFGAGGIPSFRFLTKNGGTGGAGDYQYGVSPTIPKINTQVLVLNYRIQWARRII